MAALAAAALAGLLLALAPVVGADTDAAAGNAGRRLLVSWYAFSVISPYLMADVWCTLFLAVAALGNLYTSWNSPAQLAGWSAAGGGDPCGTAWMGVTCSGSAITAMYRFLVLKSLLMKREKQLPSMLARIYLLISRIML